VAVLVALDAAARIPGPVELVQVALLLRRVPAAAAPPPEQPLEHEPDLSRPPLH
jgi:hypothetical protein